MKIRFALTRLDLFKARMSLVFSNRILQVLWLGVAIFVSYSAVTTKVALEHGLGFRVILAVAETALVLGFSFLMMAILNLVQTYTGKSRGVLGEHTLRIMDEGLEESTEYNTSLHRWSAFEKCRVRGGLLFIYVTDTMAHIIPLRRPLLEGDLAEFRRHLDEKLKAHNKS